MIAVGQSYKRKSQSEYLKTMKDVVVCGCCKCFASAYELLCYLYSFLVAEPLLPLVKAYDEIFSHSMPEENFPCAVVIVGASASRI